MPVFVEHVFAVRATTVDGAVIDLLLFADDQQAEAYVRSTLVPLPLGFDHVRVVPRRVIGDVMERRNLSRKDTVL